LDPEEDDFLVFEPLLLRVVVERERDELFEGLRLMEEREVVLRDEMPEELPDDCREFELLMYRLPLLPEI